MDGREPKGERDQRARDTSHLGRFATSSSIARGAPTKPRPLAFFGVRQPVPRVYYVNIKRVISGHRIRIVQANWRSE